ncbi:uncharacterized protein LOC143245914 [Tachypleus tridentatus]|uniref:uncharacterized protein LOC143245914 n=1 Tax=Tachypleus tridentatus TaxID=6853 RepID=UPI003FD329A1
MNTSLIALWLSPSALIHLDHDPVCGIPRFGLKLATYILVAVTIWSQQLRKADGVKLREKRQLKDVQIMYGGWTPILPGHPFYFHRTKNFKFNVGHEDGILQGPLREGLLDHQVGILGGANGGFNLDGNTLESSGGSDATIGEYGEDKQNKGYELHNVIQQQTPYTEVAISTAETYNGNEHKGNFNLNGELGKHGYNSFYIPPKHTPHQKSKDIFKYYPPAVTVSSYKSHKPTPLYTDSPKRLPKLQGYGPLKITDPGKGGNIKLQPLDITPSFALLPNIHLPHNTPKFNGPLNSEKLNGLPSPPFINVYGKGINAESLSVNIVNPSHLLLSKPHGPSPLPINLHRPPFLMPQDHGKGVNIEYVSLDIVDSPTIPPLKSQGRPGPHRFPSASPPGNGKEVNFEYIPLDIIDSPPLSPPKPKGPPLPVLNPHRFPSTPPQGNGKEVNFEYIPLDIVDSPPLSISRPKGPPLPVLKPHGFPSAPPQDHGKGIKFDIQLDIIDSPPLSLPKPKGPPLPILKPHRFPSTPPQDHGKGIKVEYIPLDIIDSPPLSLPKPKGPPFPVLKPHRFPSTPPQGNGKEVNFEYIPLDIIDSPPLSPARPKGPPLPVLKPHGFPSAPPQAHGKGVKFEYIPLDIIDSPPLSPPKPKGPPLPVLKFSSSFTTGPPLPVLKPHGFPSAPPQAHGKGVNFEYIPLDIIDSPPLSPPKPKGPPLSVPKPHRFPSTPSQDNGKEVNFEYIPLDIVDSRPLSLSRPKGPPLPVIKPHGFPSAPPQGNGKELNTDLVPDNIINPSSFPPPKSHGHPPLLKPHGFSSAPSHGNGKGVGIDVVPFHIITPPSFLPLKSHSLTPSLQLEHQGSLSPLPQTYEKKVNFEYAPIEIIEKNTLSAPKPNNPILPQKSYSPPSLSDNYERETDVEYIPVDIVQPHISLPPSNAHSPPPPQLKSHEFSFPQQEQQHIHEEKVNVKYVPIEITEPNEPSPSKPDSSLPPSSNTYDKVTDIEYVPVNIVQPQVPLQSPEPHGSHPTYSPQSSLNANGKSVNNEPRGYGQEIDFDIKEHPFSNPVPHGLSEETIIPPPIYKGYSKGAINVIDPPPLLSEPQLRPPTQLHTYVKEDEHETDDVKEQLLASPKFSGPLPPPPQTFLKEVDVEYVPIKVIEPPLSPPVPDGPPPHSNHYSPPPQSFVEEENVEYVPVDVQESPQSPPLRSNYHSLPPSPPQTFTREVNVEYPPVKEIEPPQSFVKEVNVEYVPVDVQESPQSPPLRPNYHSLPPSPPQTFTREVNVEYPPVKEIEPPQSFVEEENVEYVPVDVQESPQSPPLRPNYHSLSPSPPQTFTREVNVEYPPVKEIELPQSPPVPPGPPSPSNHYIPPPQSYVKEVGVEYIPDDAQKNLPAPSQPFRPPKTLNVGSDGDIAYAPVEAVVSLPKHYEHSDNFKTDGYRKDINVEYFQTDVIESPHSKIPLSRGHGKDSNIEFVTLHDVPVSYGNNLKSEPDQDYSYGQAHDEKLGSITFDLIESQPVEKAQLGVMVAINDHYPNKETGKSTSELYHAYYAPRDHIPPPGYIRLTIEEFEKRFKDANIQHLDSTQHFFGTEGSQISEIIAKNNSEIINEDNQTKKTLKSQNDYFEPVLKGSDSSSSTVVPKQKFTENSAEKQNENESESVSKFAEDSESEILELELKPGQSIEERLAELGTVNIDGVDVNVSELIEGDGYEVIDYDDDNQAVTSPSEPSEAETGEEKSLTQEYSEESSSSGLRKDLGTVDSLSDTKTHQRKETLHDKVKPDIPNLFGYRIKEPELKF